MQWLTFTLRLESDFGGPMRGDSLFGQLCWTLRLCDGEAALTRALEGYTAGDPFLIVSDACPEKFAPKPEIPAPPIAIDRIKDLSEWIRRKAWAARAWLPSTALKRPLIDALRDDGPEHPAKADTVLQPHNTIDRMTGTTGSGAFAPYQTTRLAVHDQRVEVHCVHDPGRLSADRLRDLMVITGRSGYGRDASLGLGKFSIIACDERPPEAEVSTVVALAPCRPAGGDVRAEESFWRPFTRFGRHGGPAFGAVFKTPALMADRGALFTLSRPNAKPFIGVGLGGDGRLSRLIPQTVQQAYAPVLPVNLEGWHG
jgi:CRISPR-associated protein Csm4